MLNRFRYMTPTNTANWPNLMHTVAEGRTMTAADRALLRYKATPLLFRVDIENRPLYLHDALNVITTRVQGYPLRHDLQRSTSN